MPKMKTKSSAKKRFKVTASGKITGKTFGDLAKSADGVLSWAAVLCHELRQLERDGPGSRWAEEARRLYLQQLPLLRLAAARVEA